MHIANQLQALWQPKPRPLFIEYPFIIEFEGLEIKGRIDQIRADPDPYGQVLVEGLDLKTGKRLMSQMDAFLQAFLYNEAAYQCPDLPVPDYWTFYMARHNKPQHGKIDRERHTRIAAKILKRVKNQIQSGDYAPQYGLWCDWCDYRQLCETEISMWSPGQDTLVLS
jgi:RecB family exonuclease